MTMDAEAPPWKSDVPYGPHPRQILDIYLPEGEGPFPVAIHIHGGAWSGGHKVDYIKPGWRDRFLGHGVAMVSVEYRFLADAREAGIFPPVLAPLEDAKRALQFVRAQAQEWNFDPARVALFGGSAGGFSALWIALSPDMAKPDSSDPVARQSTRVPAVATFGAQTSIDPKQMREWVGPQLEYGGNAFGMEFEEFFNRREEFAEWYPKLSPVSLVKTDSPPIFLQYNDGLNMENPPPGYYTHSPRFGIGFLEVARQRKATCLLRYPGRAEAPEIDYVDFLIAELKK